MKDKSSTFIRESLNLLTSESFTGFSKKSSAPSSRHLNEKQIYKKSVLVNSSFNKVDSFGSISFFVVYVANNHNKMARS